MLAVGRTLMGNPAVLLLDEPLEGLAPVIVESLMQAFERLRSVEGLSIILVEQHARLALNFAEDAVILSRGSVVYSGPSGALISNPNRLAVLIGVAEHDGRNVA